MPRPALSQIFHCSVALGFVFFVRKQDGVAERRAFDDFAGPLVVAWEFRSYGQVRAALHQKLRHGQAAIEKLRHCMKNRRLSADTTLVQHCAGVDVRPLLQK